MYHIINESQAIREIQRYLLEISYATDGLPHLSVDGIYGEETRGGVREFQRRNGLEASGQVDPATWDELYRQYDLARRERIEQPPLLPPDALPLALSAEGSEVALLQVLLVALQAELATLPPLRQSGRFDQETQRALRAYQVARRLPASGILDRETWQHLTQDYQNRDPGRHAG